MIRSALLTGTFLVACATLAFAQPMSGQGYQGNNNEGPMHQMEGRGEGWGNGWGMMRHGFEHGHEEAIMGIATALASGTFYRFRRGDDEVDIHCPARQSLQDCVSGATQLMHTLQQTGSPVAGGGHG